MYGALTTAGGAGLGGLAGQLGDTMSAPRRAVWGALGLPDSGSELLHQTLGMDPDSLMTKGLGMGAEVLGDPLTYAGMGLGKLGGMGAEGAAGALGRFLGDESGALKIPASMLGDAAKAGEASAELQGGTRALGLPTGGGPEGVFPGARLNLPEEGKALPLPEGMAKQDLSAGPVPELEAKRRAHVGELQEELDQDLAGYKSLNEVLKYNPNFPHHLGNHGFINMNHTPAQAQESIGNLYRLLGDFEQDAAAGQAGAPVEVMAKRSQLWQEILRAEKNFQDLGHESGRAWGAPQSPFSAWETWMSNVPEDNPAAAQWFGSASRDFTPEQVAAIVQRANDVRGERSMLPMIPEEHRARLSDVLDHELNGVEYGQTVHNGTHDLHSRATSPGIAGAPDLRDLEDAAYARVDQPALYLQQGRGGEQEALGWIARLKAQGYPVDEQLAMDLWRHRSGLRGAV